MGFAFADQGDVGVDSNKAEIIVNGSLVLLGNPTNPVVLRSARPDASAACGDWYGIRTASLGSVTATSATIMHARAGLALETGTWPDLGAVKDEITFSGNCVEISFDRDQVIASGDTLQIDAGWTIGFAALRDEGGAGADPNRVELVADGFLEALGTSGNPVILTSDNPTGERGGWYGIRLSDVSKVLDLSDYLDVRNAGGALSLEGAAASAMPDLAAIGAKVTFTNNKSDICFDRDLYVAQSDSLVIPPGWRIGFVDSADANNVGNDTALSELVVDGYVRAGELGQEAVWLTSNAPESDPAPWWYGLLHREDPDTLILGSSGAGYGYTGVSELANVTVEDAALGIVLESYAAPEIDSVTFVGDGVLPNTPVHIYLNKTDVEIPFYDRWHLLAGTHVVAADTTVWHVVGSDTIGGDYSLLGFPKGASGKVDLIVQGALVTSGTSQDPVVFTPESPSSPTFADEWGGVLVDGRSVGTVIDHARMGYAEYPLTIYANGNGPVVKNSAINHFGEAGVWLLGCYGTPATLDGNAIEFGDDLDGSLGVYGILITDTSPGTVKNNSVDFLAPDENNDKGGAAIGVGQTKVYCDTAPTGAQELLLEANTLTGPGATFAQFVWAGVDLSRVCGTAGRVTTARLNRIWDWSESGIEMVDATDVQVSHNCIVDNRRALKIVRDEEAAGPNVRLERNELRASSLSLATHKNLVVVESPGSDGVAFGPDVAGVTGRNVLRHEKTATTYLFIKETDTDSTLSLDARGNLWKLASAVQDTAAIGSRLQSSPPDTVDYLPFKSSGSGNGPSISCEHLTSVPYLASSGPVVGEAPDRPVRIPDDGQERLVSALGVGWPMPFRTAVDVEFIVGRENPTYVTIDVYNVAGRKVARPVDGVLDYGRYRFRWHGRDSAGREVASGVYFVRMVVGDEKFHRKLVKVR